MQTYTRHTKQTLKRKKNNNNQKHNNNKTSKHDKYKQQAQEQQTYIQLTITLEEHERQFKIQQNNIIIIKIVIKRNRNKT